MDKYLCSIPIYRCTESVFYEERDRELAAYLKLFKETDDDEYWKEYYTRDFFAAKTYSFRHNEVVGYIDLIVNNSKITFELYFINTKKIRRGFKKTNMIFIQKLGEFSASLYKTQSNQEIGGSIEHALNTYMSDLKLLKNRHIDKNNLKQLLTESLNWKNILFGED